MESTVFRAGVDTVDVEIISRECRIRIGLAKSPPEVWVDEFMRSERFGLPLFRSRVFVDEDAIIIRVPKRRREPIDTETVEHEFKLSLNKIREINRRFLIFEEVRPVQKKKPAISEEEAASSFDPIIEPMQEQLASILSEWKNDKKLHFEI